MKRDEFSRRAWREEGNFKAHQTMATTIKTKTFLAQEYALEIGGISMLAQVLKFGRVWKLRVTEGAWPYVTKMGSNKPVIELKGNTLDELAAKLNEGVPWEKWLASIITPDAKRE